MGYLISEDGRLLGGFLWYGKKPTRHKATCPACGGAIIKGSPEITVLAKCGRYPHYEHFHRRCFLLALKEAFVGEGDHSLDSISEENLEDVRASKIIRKLGGDK